MTLRSGHVTVEAVTDPGVGTGWIPRGLLDWSFAGNTLGRAAGEPNFGQVADGRPFWIGHFSCTDRSQVLF